MEGPSTHDASSSCAPATSTASSLANTNAGTVDPSLVHSGTSTSMTGLRLTNKAQGARRWKYKHRRRRVIAEFLDSTAFEAALGVVISTNICIIVMETNANAGCEGRGADAVNCQEVWMDVCNHVFLGIYTLELMARIYAHRLTILHDVWCMLDFVIVLSGYVDLLVTLSLGAGFPDTKLLRVVRVLRLVRAVRLLEAFPELRVMVRGFVGAISAMLWGFFAILVMLLVFAILTVEFVNPVNQTLKTSAWCEDAFNSVFTAILLQFQALVAGDSWGACSIPVIKKAPLTFLLFAGSFVCIQLGFTNLILAVIVDRAAQAREFDAKAEIESMHTSRTNARQRMREICKNIDTDGSGHITLDELLRGYSTEPELRLTLELLEMRKEDLTNLFRVMDVDGSETVSYSELIDCLHKSDSQDPRRQIMFLKLQIESVKYGLNGRLDTMAEAMERIQASLSALSAPPPEAQGDASRDASRGGAPEPALPCEQRAQAVPLLEASQEASLKLRHASALGVGAAHEHCPGAHEEQVLHLHMGDVDRTIISEPDI